MMPQHRFGTSTFDNNNVEKIPHISHTLLQISLGTDPSVFIQNVRTGPRLLLINDKRLHMDEYHRGANNETRMNDM